MSPEVERDSRIKSGIATALITIALFLLFWFYTLHYDLPVLPESSEVEVMLEEPNSGGGSEAAASETVSSPDIPSMKPPVATEQTPDEEAVAVKKSPQEPVKPSKPSEDDELLNSMIKGKKNQKPVTSSDQGDGDGSGSGKGGSGSGSGGGDGSGVGSGSGPGTSHSFRGRSFYLGPGKNNCNQEGKVILDVVLKPDGRIVYEGVNPGSRGSTCLEQVAISYLRSSSFNASENPVSVEGTITFIFKLK